MTEDETVGWHHQFNQYVVQMNASDMKGEKLLLDLKCSMLLALQRKY